MMKQNFFTFIGVFLLLNACNSKAVLWIDSARDAIGDGSQTAPFKDVSYAFRQISSGSAENTFEILFAATKNPYQGWNVSGSKPNTSLTISTWGESNNTFSTSECNSYPILNLQTNQKFIFNNLAHLEISQVSFDFDDLVNYAIPQISVEDEKLLKITNSCFKMRLGRMASNPSRNELPTSFMNVFGNVSEIIIQSIQIEKNASGFSLIQITDIDTVKASFGNISISHQFYETYKDEFEKYSIFVMNTKLTSSFKNSFIAKRIRLLLLSSEGAEDHYIGNLCPVFEITAKEVSINDVEIANINSSHSHPLKIFRFRNASKLEITKLTLNNLRWISLKYDVSIFFLEHIDEMQINTLRIINSIISNKIRIFELDNSQHQTYKIKNISFDSLFISSSVLENGAAGKDEFGTIFSAFSFDALNLSITNLEIVKGSSFENCQLFQFESKDYNFISRNSIIKITNFSISDSSFKSSNILTLSSITKNTIIKNFSCNNNIFSIKYVESYLFAIQADLSFEISGISFNNNTITSYTIFLICPSYKIAFFMNSAFLETTFVDSSLTETSDSLIEYNMVVFSPILYFEGVNFSNITVDNKNDNGILMCNGPYFFITGCNFNNINPTAGKFILFRENAQGESTDFYDYKEIKDTYKVEFAKIMEFVTEAKDIYKQPVTQYRFENNSIWNVRGGTNKGVLEQMSSFPYSNDFIAVSYLQTKSLKSVFVNKNNFADIFSPISFIKMVLCDYVKVLENSFSNFTGNGGNALLFEAFSNEKRLSIESNTLSEFSGLQFIRVITKDMNSLSFLNNSLKDSTFGAYSLFFYIDEIETSKFEFKFIGNSFFNISLEKTETKRLIDIQIQKQGKVYFFNNSITNIRLSNQESDFQNGKSVIYVIAREGEVKIERYVMEFVDERSQIDYLALYSQTVSFIDSSFLLSGGSVSKNVLSITSDNIFVERASFSSNNTSNSKNTTILNVEPLSLERDRVCLSIKKSTFSFSQEPPSQIISYAVKAIYRMPSLSFTFRDNSLIHLAELGFKDVKFSEFNIQNSSLVLSQSNSFKIWIRFSNCSGNINLENVEILGLVLNGINLVRVKSSPKLSLNLTQLSIKTNDSHITSPNYLQVVNTDSGNVLVDGLTLKNTLLSGPMFFITSAQEQVNMSLKNFNIVGSQSHDYKTAISNSYQGGLIYIENSNFINLTVSDSLFERIQYADGSSLININSSKNLEVTIVNSSFREISAIQGSVLSLDLLGTTRDDSSTQKVEVKNSIFSRNNATKLGGSIYLRNAVLSLEKCIFENNSALLGPSIFLRDPKNLDSFLNGSLQSLEKEIGVQPSSFVIGLTKYQNNQRDFYEVSDGKSVTINNVTSYEMNFMEIKIMDALSRPFRNPNNSTVNLIVGRTNESPSSSSSSCSETYCITNNITNLIGGYEGESENITLKFITDNFQMSSTIQVKFRNCITGEVKNIINEKRGCRVCPSDEYSFNASDTFCAKCPTGANCSGGSNMVLQRGYWRNSTNLSDLIPRPCEKNSSQNDYSRCKGGINSDCQEGFKGPLCHQYDLAEGYTRTGSETNFNCEKCNDQAWQLYLNSLLFFLVFLGYEVYYIYTATKSGRSYYETSLKENENVVFPSYGPYFNLLTTYFQIITIISVFDIKTFSYLFSFASVVGEPVARITFSLDCILLRWHVNPDNLLTIRITFLLCSPLIKWIVLIAYFAIRGLNRNRKMIIGAAGLSFFLLEQLQIIAGLIEFLTCRRLDPFSDATFVQNNEYFSCGTWQYQLLKYWVVYPALLLFCFLPLGLLLILYTKKNHNKLDSEWVRCTLGSLYNGLKKKVFFWGIVGNYSKIGLIIITKPFIINAPGLLAPLMISWFYAYRLLLSWRKPYLSQQLLQAEKYTLNAYLVTIFCAFFMKDNEQNIALILLYMILILMANIYALTYVAFVLYVMSKRKAEDRFSKLKSSKCWKFMLKIFFRRPRITEPNSTTNSFEMSEEKDEEKEEERTTDYMKLKDQDNKDQSAQNTKIVL